MPYPASQCSRNYANCAWQARTSPIKASLNWRRFRACACSTRSKRRSPTTASPNSNRHCQTPTSRSSARSPSFRPSETLQIASESDFAVHDDFDDRDEFGMAGGILQTNSKTYHIVTRQSESSNTPRILTSAEFDHLRRMRGTRSLLCANTVLGAEGL